MRGYIVDKKPVLLVGIMIGLLCDTTGVRALEQGYPSDLLPTYTLNVDAIENAVEGLFPDTHVIDELVNPIDREERIKMAHDVCGRLQKHAVILNGSRPDLEVFPFDPTDQELKPVVWEKLSIKDNVDLLTEYYDATSGRQTPLPEDSVVAELKNLNSLMKFSYEIDGKKLDFYRLDDFFSKGFLNNFLLQYKNIKDSTNFHYFRYIGGVLSFIQHIFYKIDDQKYKEAVIRFDHPISHFSLNENIFTYKGGFYSINMSAGDVGIMKIIYKRVNDVDDYEYELYPVSLCNFRLDEPDGWVKQSH